MPRVLVMYLLDFCFFHQDNTNSPCACSTITRSAAFKDWCIYKGIIINNVITESPTKRSMMSDGNVSSSVN